MKAYIFGYSTNYDLGAAIIYAESKKKAIELAKECNNIWDTNNIHEIDTNTEAKVIIIRESSFNLY